MPKKKKPSPPEGGEGWPQLWAEVFDPSVPAIYYVLKLGIAVTSLESGRWRHVAASVQAALDQFNAMFETE